MPGLVPTSAVAMLSVSLPLVLCLPYALRINDHTVTLGAVNIHRVVLVSNA